MIDLYSPLLFVALAAGAGGVVLAVAGRILVLWGQSRPEVGRRWRHAARAAVWAAVGTAVAAALWHLPAGHRPGTPGVLGPADFLAEHLAVPGFVALGLAAVLLARLGGRPR